MKHDFKVLRDWLNGQDIKLLYWHGKLSKEEAEAQYTKRTLLVTGYVIMTITVFVLSYN